MKNILIIYEHLEGRGGAGRVLIDTLNSFDIEKYNINLLLLKKSNIEQQIPKQIKKIYLTNDTIQSGQTHFN